MNFSVVTPSYGQLAWLELCIASVADQHGIGSVEHIVCDAGSDGIEEFRRRMMETFPNKNGYRLKFIIGPDQGMYDAINKGLLQAEGDVCSYLNCDEQLLPGALSAVQDFFTANPAIDAVFGDTIVVGADGSPLCYWRPYVPSARHLAGATLNTLSCSTFFRRRLIEAGHLFEPQWKVIGDMIWIRGLLGKRRPMACVPKPLAAFTYSGDNLGASDRAHSEFEISRSKSSTAGRWLARLIHGVRKLFSGAYVRRRVTYDLFALSDPSHRRRFVGDNLGWTWPGSAKKS